MFIRDSGKVLDIIKEPTLGIDAETYIKGLEWGIKVTQDLQDNCDDTPEGARRKKVAIDDWNKIFYKNETTFTFDKYVTKCKGIFNVLEKYGVPLYEDQMVENILD